jgi:hypothetical protein
LFCKFLSVGLGNICEKVYIVLLHADVTQSAMQAEIPQYSKQQKSRKVNVVIKNIYAVQ